MMDKIAYCLLFVDYRPYDTVEIITYALVWLFGNCVIDDNVTNFPGYFSRKRFYLLMKTTRHLIITCFNSSVNVRLCSY